MKQVKSYIPESEFFDTKRGRGCRIFHDDCAIVYASKNFPLIASRGFDIPSGAPFFHALSLPDGALARIEAFLHSEETHLMLRAKKYTLIIFSALLRHTGLLVVLRIKYSESDIKRVMKKLGCDAFYAIFRPEEDVKEDTSTVQEHITEILYYTDRILYATPPLDIMTRIRLIASFVGCRIESLDFAPNLPILNDQHTNILIAFFLCVLLILRQRTGENALSAKRENVGKVQEESEESNGFHIALKHSPILNFRGRLPQDEIELRDRETSPMSPLLALPCFANVFQTTDDGNLIFEIPIHIPSPYATLGAQNNTTGILICIKPL